MDATRTLTVFGITDPDEPEHHHKNLMMVVVKHGPRTQTDMEVQLRDIARQFGVRWAGMGKLFRENPERVILEFAQHGFEIVRDQVFFTVNGTGMVRPEHKPEGLLEHMAVAATEPTAAERLEELVNYAKTELLLTEESLDYAVHDAKGSEAADINNGGMQDQIEYLCAGMSFEQAKKNLFDMSEQEGSPDEEPGDDEEDDRAIDFTERRTGKGAVHEESMVGGQAFCAVCGVVTKDSDPYFHGDSFLDIPILELTIEEEPDDEVSLCALVSKKLGVELTLEDATKYMAAAFDRE